MSLPIVITEGTSVRAIRLCGSYVVDEDVYFADARQNLYKLTEPAQEFTSEERDASCTAD